MTVRALSAGFFVLYGLLLPVAARGFMAENLVSVLAMMASCFVIAAMLWSRRAVLPNILIALYVFRVYLTRPYADIFMSKIQGTSLNYVYNLNYEHLQAQDYIRSLNSYYNPSDAVVVYLSLLSLLAGWALGLHAVRPKQEGADSAPMLFRSVDEIVMGASPAFWLALALLTALNYQPAASTLQNAATGQGSRLFAWGLFSTATITIACLFAVVRSRRPGSPRLTRALLIPVIYSAILGSAAGSRSAMFSLAVLALGYALFLNWDRVIDRRNIPRIVLIVGLLSVVTVCGAVVSQMLRLLFRAGMDVKIAWTVVTASLNVSNVGRSASNGVYLVLTELLYRASSLKAQFLILNNHYVHDPRETFNPLHTLMRVFNDLVPGDPFRVIGINRLFDYIYFDRSVNYNSENWSVQGLLYLYFGFGFSPIAVFGAACLASRYHRKLAAFAEASPAFAAFFILLFGGFLEFGTFERAIPVDVVRPLVGYCGFVLLTGAIHRILVKIRGRYAATSL
jgi:hypothetical protein